jgi:hypothetical protein
MTGVPQPDHTVSHSPVAKKCARAQVVTVFLATFISGTLLNQLQQVLDRPASLLTVLGVSAPQTASFFFLYVLFVALVVVPLRLLQPVGLAVYKVRAHCGRGRGLAMPINGCTASTSAQAVC